VAAQLLIVAEGAGGLRLAGEQADQGSDGHVIVFHHLADVVARGVGRDGEGTAQGEEPEGELGSGRRLFAVVAVISRLRRGLRS
jgi:hypothetical protein